MSKPAYREFKEYMKVSSGAKILYNEFIDLAKRYCGKNDATLISGENRTIVAHLDPEVKISFTIGELPKRLSTSKSVGAFLSYDSGEMNARINEEGDYFSNHKTTSAELSERRGLRQGFQELERCLIRTQLIEKSLRRITCQLGQN